MTVNPVFLNELRQSFIRRKPLHALIIWAAVTAGLVWSAQFLPSQYPLSMLVLFAVPLIVPAFAAGSFAKEYEQQTWQDLYLTRLTNLQVVLGKFGAALLLTMAAALSMAPAMVLMYFNESSSIDITPGWWIVALLFKLLLSASLYVMMAMTCSRYSPNRRTAMVWCYVALLVYATFGYLVWRTVGQEVDRNDQLLSRDYGGEVRAHSLSMDNLAAPGFMGGLHLLFCGVVGCGTVVLLWVSLSEQRGYRSKAGVEDKRVWQPTARLGAGDRSA